MPDFCLNVIDKFFPDTPFAVACPYAIFLATKRKSRVFLGCPMNMETLLAICAGLGLAAACGFRVFVPMLITSIAVNSGHLHLTSGMAWIGSTPALVSFSLATGLE